MSEPNVFSQPPSLACPTMLHCPADETAPPVSRIAGVVANALAQPLDYPTLVEAVVPGDHIVLAIDPTIPQLGRVITGVCQALGQTGAGQIDAVLWDEATQREMTAVQQAMPPESNVVRHQGDRRADVRYLAAKQAADPIYVNRLLVDADLVIPVAAARFALAPDGHPANDADSTADDNADRGNTDRGDTDRGDQDNQQNSLGDVTGIYPMLTDSASRMRHETANAAEVPADQTAWLLGVQFLLVVVPGLNDNVQAVFAGTLAAVKRQLADHADRVLPGRGNADLVVAVVESGTPQTWHSIVRAAASAAALAGDEATLVLWTDTAEPIPHLASGSSRSQLTPGDAFEGEFDQAVEFATGDQADGESSVDSADQDFPAWNAYRILAAKLSELGTRNRILVRSRCDDESIELAGFGSIKTADELIRLSRGFDTGCVLRRASFLVPSTREVPILDSFAGSGEQQN